MTSDVVRRMPTQLAASISDILDLTPREALQQAVKPSEKVTKTTYQIFKDQMKHVEKEAQKAYMAGARDIVKTHKNLAKFAAEQLEGIDITKAQRKTLMNSIARPRTDAEQVTAMATVMRLVDKAKHKTAVDKLKGQISRLKKTLRKSKVRDAAIERIEQALARVDLTTLSESKRKQLEDIRSDLKEVGFLIEEEFNVPDVKELGGIEAVVGEETLQQLQRLGKKSLADMTAEEVEEIADTIRYALDQNKKAVIEQRKQYEQTKKDDLSAVVKNSVPITDKDIIKSDKIGEGLTPAQRAKNTFTKMLNFAAQKVRSIATPMDVLFDLLDGGKAMYDGVNYTLFKKNLDDKWSAYLNRRDGMRESTVQLAVDLQLNKGNYERIGVYAALQQENGRQKLLDTGYTEEQIDNVTLTDDEMRLYEKMRKDFDSLGPEIEQLMERAYNQPFRKVKNYFSFMTDFESMSDFEVREMYGDRAIDYSSSLRKNVERGFTKQRTGGRQNIKINAMEIYLQHIDHASYLLEMGEEIKRLSEIASTKEYKDAVGARGQEEVRSWLDLMARMGGVERNKTIRSLDVVRKHVGAATIGFKLSSAMVNATPFLDGAGLIGRYAFQGASDVLSGEWRKFVIDNFPELRDRIGGDIDFLEFGDTPIQKLERKGFWVLQKIDEIAASAIAIGAYQKYLNDNNIKMSFRKPNAEAISYAQRTMRRSQSSAFYKDLPSGFTRGTLTGNKSIDRLFLQFQSFMMNRWSLIKHDMLRGGIRTKNVTQAANMFFWLAMAGFAEMGLRRLSKEMVAMVTGEDTEEWEETFTEEIVVNLLQNIPFLTQAVSVYNYGQIPVPTIAVMNDMVKQLDIYKKTKDPDKKKIRALEAIITIVGSSAGLPGTRQVTQAITSKRRASQKKSPGTIFEE
jgi:hypothetical protein